MARRPSNSPETIANVLRLLPAKWVIGLLVVVLLYYFAQPRLNAWFGWHLPTIAAMTGQEEPAKVSRSSNSKSPSPTASNSSTGRASQTTKPSPSSKPGPTTKPDPRATESDGRDDWKYRVLKPIGRERYESPAGLVYGPGSEEGHRLDHIAKHLRDEPDRPGSHGVFEGDMASFLVAIDDAYKRARGHAKGTKSRVEDGATVMEAPFDQAIGYLGGSEGARKKNPKLKRLRLVLRDRNLITAFPIQ